MHAAAGRSHQSSKAVLKQHVAAGNLVNVRRHLYAVVPPGMTPDTAPIDPYLLCSRLCPDAVIAYHAALRWHGRAHSVSRRFAYLCARRPQPLSFRGEDFVPVLAPASLRELADFGGGVRKERRQGLELRVATLERTLVDLMDAPQHGGGWEEIWRSLESVEYFDLDAVIRYAERLGSAVAAARVGYFLERHRKPLMVEGRHLAALQRLRPRQARYFDRRLGTGGKLMRRWNLIVPASIEGRSWGEVL